ADRNRSHWSTSKTPSYTKSVSWQHHQADGSNTVDYNFAVWSNNLLLLPFTAQLVPDGSGAAVGVGTFSGNATFSFTYE
ncbi:hypothetical protein ACK6WQ_09160, partial [Escherichia coli]